MNFLDIKRKLLPISGFLMGGGGSSGGSQNVNSTVTNSNIPAYAQPYVENMLGATQSQIFTGPDGGPLIRNAEGNYDIGGFQPYRAYGGDYDAAGNQTAYNPSAGIAGFSPLQTQSQIGIKGLTTPTEYNDAIQYVGNTGQALQKVGAGFSPNTYTNSFSAPTKTDLSYTADTYGGAAAGSSTDAVGDTASGATLDQTKMPTAVGQTTDYKAGVVNPKTGIRSLERFQMNDPDQVSTASFTDKGVASSYMSPYMQNVVDIQQREAQRQADIANTQQQAAATQAGGFGGSRDSIMRAEAARNLATQKGDIQAQGQQAAYQQAQQQFNAEQGYGLQGQIANQQAGLTQGQQNLGANLGVQQLDTQTGLQTSLANLGNLQQAEMANKALIGQYGLTQGQMTQQANMQTSAQKQQAAIQNAAAKNQRAEFNASNLQQAGLQGSAAKNQAAQFGAGQNLASAQNTAQYGLGANQLTEQSGQFGAGNQLNSAQAQLQTANQYAQLANQKLAAQQGILGLQNATGAQQQAYKQQINNQAMQDYANAQQYPLMQLGTMSNMLRGLPMQAQNTSMYTAQPNFATQAIGNTGALMNYPYAKAPGTAKGGVIHKASGGITSIPQYDVGGSVRSKLEGMTTDDIKEYLKESDSRAIKQMAQAILREKMGMAGGGIIAFKQGDPVDEEIAQAYNAPRETPRDVAVQQAAAAPNPRAITAVPAQSPAKAQSPTNPLMDFSEDQKIIDQQRAGYDAQRTKADRPQAAFITEEQEARKALGLDQNEALAVQRANAMAEKANLKDEAEYKRKMELVNFFATWGSTPGDTLVAGMQALRKSIPNFVQNAEDEKKARKEADKAIYLLDDAVRLEKIGVFDKATAAKNKAAEIANDLQVQLVKSQQAMLKAQKDTAVAEAQIKGHKEVAQIGAAGHLAVAGENRAARVEAAGVRKKDEEKELNKNIFLLADRQIQEADNKYEVSKAVKTGEYYNANRTKEQLERLDKLDDMQKKKLDLANKKLSELDAAHATRITGLTRKKDIAGREFYGPRYDAMTTSGSPTALPAGFVPD
jgi:hypothetical protein